MACDPTYRGIGKIKDLRDRCDVAGGGFEVKDMAEMTLAELRTLFKYADLMHDHCDGDRTTVLNCAKNRYHLIPNELQALVMPGRAAGGAINPSTIPLINFLKAIHIDDKFLNTNDIEDSFSTLLSYAFPREFGGTTVEIRPADRPETKANKTAQILKRLKSLSNVYGAPEEASITLSVDTILAGNYDIDTLRDYNTLQLTANHRLSPLELANIGQFIHAYYSSHYNPGPGVTLRYNVFCDSSPNVKAFMKAAPGSPFSQIYTAQSVLDSASSGRKLLGNADVPMYAGPVGSPGLPHEYTTYALTNSTSGIGRANRVATIKTMAINRAGIEKIIITTTLTNIEAPVEITETLIVSEISNGPTLPYIAELNDNIHSILSNIRDINIINPVSFVDKITSDIGGKMWNMRATLIQFIEAYKNSRRSVNQLMDDLLDYINDWKGFGDAEMVRAAEMYPVADGTQKMFITGDRVSAMFGRFAGLPTAMSNTKDEHMLYRPVVQQQAGGRVLSELKLLCDRLQTYYNNVRQFVLFEPYMNSLTELKTFTVGTCELLKNRDNYRQLPPYIKLPLYAKLQDLGIYISNILNNINSLSALKEIASVSILPSIIGTQQIVFGPYVKDFDNIYRGLNEEQVNAAYIYPITNVLLEKLGTVATAADNPLAAVINTILTSETIVPLTFTPETVGKRKRPAEQSVNVHFISLPFLIELLKLFLVNLEPVIPELIQLTTHLQRITRLEIFDNGSVPNHGKFINKIQKLSTTLQSGDYFKLNTALNFRPTEFTKIALEYDTLMKSQIKYSTINNRHPFILALRSVGKTFFVKEYRTKYDDFIMGELTDFLEAAIGRTLQGFERVRIWNESKKNTMELTFNRVFMDLLEASMDRMLVGGANDDDNDLEGTTGGLDGSPLFDELRLGNISSLFNIMNEFILDFYDTNTISNNYVTFGDQNVNLYIFNINTVETPPTNVSSVGVDAHIAEPILENMDEINPLDIYITSVISRVGFTNDSYIFMDELYTMCKNVFEMPTDIDKEGIHKRPLKNTGPTIYNFNYEGSNENNGNGKEPSRKRKKENNTFNSSCVIIKPNGSSYVLDTPACRPMTFPITSRKNPFRTFGQQIRNKKLATQKRRDAMLGKKKNQVSGNGISFGALSVPPPGGNGSHMRGGQIKTRRRKVPRTRKRNALKITKKRKTGRKAHTRKVR